MDADAWTKKFGKITPKGEERRNRVAQAQTLTWSLRESRLTNNVAAMMTWRLLLGLVLSAVLTLYIVSKIKFEELFAVLQSIRLFPILLAFVALLFTLFIRAWRWRFFLPSAKPIRSASLLSATCVGAMANMILPARAGDLVRVYMIAQKEQVGRLVSLASIVVERVVDVLVLCLLLAGILTFVDFPVDKIAIVDKLKVGAYLSGLLGLVTLGAMLVLGFKTRQSIKMMKLCLFFLPERLQSSVVEILNTVASGLGAMQKGKNLLPIAMFSVLLTLACGLSNFLVLVSFDLDLPLYAAFLLLAVQTIGLMLPSSPGFIGTYHAAIVAGFAFFEVSNELVISVAIVMHAILLFASVLPGLLFVLWENVPVGKLSSDASAPK